MLIFVSCFNQLVKRMSLFFCVSSCILVGSPSTNDIFSSDNSPFWLTVQLGPLTQESNSHKVSRSVERIVFHHNYEGHMAEHNVIALIKLISPVEFTDFIRPVCLAASDSVFNHGTDSRVTVWAPAGEDGSSNRTFKQLYSRLCLHVVSFICLFFFPVENSWSFKLEGAAVTVVGNRHCACMFVKGLVGESTICSRFSNEGDTHQVL